jgi:chaperone modulatory protein CbpM
MPGTRAEGVKTLVSLDELLVALGVEDRVVTEYVELGIAKPRREAGGPAFTPAEVARLTRALRLARELELHAAAAALLVDLLEERDDLVRQVGRLERELRGID